MTAKEEGRKTERKRRRGRKKDAGRGPGKHRHSSKYLKTALLHNPRALLVDRHSGLESVLERDLKTDKAQEHPKHPQTDKNVTKQQDSVQS